MRNNSFSEVFNASVLIVIQGTNICVSEMRFVV